MKSRRLKFALSIITFVIGCPAFALAQVTVDVSKITCKQFVLHEIARPHLVAIWLSGYYAGMRQLPTINIQALEKNRKQIERFCTKVDNLELPLMQAVEKVLGSGHKPQLRDIPTQCAAPPMGEQVGCRPLAR